MTDFGCALYSKLSLRKVFANCYDDEMTMIMMIMMMMTIGTTTDDGDNDTMTMMITVMLRVMWIITINSYKSDQLIINNYRLKIYAIVYVLLRIIGDAPGKPTCVELF